MVSYEPLWKTMKQKDITTYTLIGKYKVLSKTIYNLKHNKHITTATLNSPMNHRAKNRRVIFQSTALEYHSFPFYGAVQVYQAPGDQRRRASFIHCM